MFQTTNQILLEGRMGHLRHRLSTVAKHGHYLGRIGKNWPVDGGWMEKLDLNEL